jgi:hypothetical protein
LTLYYIFNLNVCYSFCHHSQILYLIINHTNIAHTALHAVEEGVEDSDEYSNDEDEREDRQPLGMVTKKNKKKNKVLNVEVDVVKKDEDNISPSPIASDDEEEEDGTPSDDEEERGKIRYVTYVQHD